LEKPEAKVNRKTVEEEKKYCGENHFAAGEAHSKEFVS